MITCRLTPTSSLRGLKVRHCSNRQVYFQVKTKLDQIKSTVCVNSPDALDLIERRLLNPSFFGVRESEPSVQWRKETVLQQERRYFWSRWIACQWKVTRVLRGKRGSDFWRQKRRESLTSNEGTVNRFSLPIRVVVNK